MTDDKILVFALEVIEKGYPLAGVVVLIVAAWLKFGRPASSGSEVQMTAALKALEARVQANHEAAQEHREELKDSMALLGERVARIEGQLSHH